MGEDKHKPVIAVDFDGVIADYHGWYGEEHFGEPISGAQRGLKSLVLKGWFIAIWTTRRKVGLIAHWLREHDIPFDSINEVPHRDYACKKISADIYLDDRGLRFNGVWNQELLNQIVNFRTHWEEFDGTSEDFTPQ